MKLYISQLIDKGACRDQVRLFRARFGESVDVTPELCASVAAEFDFSWAARYLLSPPALAEYQRAKAPARAEYQRATATAFAKYQRATAPAWAEYQRATATAFAEYQRATASAFANAYNAMGVQS